MVKLRGFKRLIKPLDVGLGFFFIFPSLLFIFSAFSFRFFFSSERSNKQPHMAEDAAAALCFSLQQHLLSSGNGRWDPDCFGQRLVCVMYTASVSNPMKQ